MNISDHAGWTTYYTETTGDVVILMKAKRILAAVLALLMLVRLPAARRAKVRKEATSSPAKFRSSILTVKAKPMFTETK